MHRQVAGELTVNENAWRVRDSELITQSQGKGQLGEARSECATGDHRSVAEEKTAHLQTVR
jgi:hypothetical protein